MGEVAMSNTLRTVLIIVVATVWAINFTAPIFVDGYEPAAELNVAFMAIIGILTASYEKDSSKKRNQKKEVDDGPAES